MAKNELTILGSGTSTGVPMLDCDCQVCTSPKSENKRLRTAVLLKTGKGKTIIIDTPPDLRTQLLKEKINHVDGAIITHDHADHLHGLDDLRAYTFGPPRRSLPIFTHPIHAHYLRKRFGFGKYDSLIAGGRYHNSKDFINFPNAGPKYLEFKPTKKGTGQSRISNMAYGIIGIYKPCHSKGKSALSSASATGQSIL